MATRKYHVSDGFVEFTVLNQGAAFNIASRLLKGSESVIISQFVNGVFSKSWSVSSVPAFEEDLV